MIRIALFTAAKFFVWGACPIYLFQLYSGLEPSPDLWKFWLSALFSVIGVFLLVRLIEKHLKKGGWLPD
jgi:hypothetical protein